MPPFDEPVAPQHEEEPDTPPLTGKQRLRRWTIGLGIAAVLIALLAFPVARFAVDKLLTDALEAEGMQGSVDVSGNLFSGFTLQNASFSGNDRVQKVAFDRVEVRYSVGELLKKNVDLFSASDISLRLDLRKESPRPPAEKEKKDPAPLAETLRSARELLRPIKIDVGTIDAEIILPDGSLIHADIADIEHISGDDDIVLSGFQVKHRRGDSGTVNTTPVQDVRITWSEDAFELDSLELLPDIRVRAIDLRIVEADKIAAAGALDLYDATIALSSPTPTQIELELTDGSIDMGRLQRTFLEKAPLEGSIDDLSLSLRDLDLPLDEIKGSLVTSGSDLKLRMGAIPISLKQINIDVEIIDETLIAQMQVGSSSRERIEFPLSGIESTSDFAAFGSRAVHFEVQIDSTHRLLTDLEGLVASDQLASIPDGRIDLSGAVDLSGSGVASINADFLVDQLTLSSAALPAAKGNLVYDVGATDVVLNGELFAGDDRLSLQGSYNASAQAFEAQVSGKLPTTAAIQQQIESATQLRFVSAPEVDIKASGYVGAQKYRVESASVKGQLRDRSGRLFDVATQLEADFPSSVTVQTLGISTDEGAFTFRGDWADDRLTIEALDVESGGEALASINGELPAPRSAKSALDLLDIDSEIDLNISANKLTMSRLRKIIPMQSDDLVGRLDGELSIAGTYARPVINGSFVGADWQLVSLRGLRPVSFSIEAKTTDQTLALDGRIAEGGEPVARLTGSLPLAITSWVTGEEAFSSSPINARLITDQLALARFRALVPQVNRLSGTTTIDLALSGSVADPQFDGTAELNIDRMRFDNENIPDLRESRIDLAFDRQTIRIKPSRLNGSGGIFDLSGDVTVGENVAFDIKLDASKALLYRDDSVNVRADAQLTLRGTKEQARLAGRLGFAETLYYRDIEIIPSGIPASSVPEPRLPKVDRADSGSSELPIPEPFANWTLDVDVTTIDPILIRGNLAKGRITGEGRIGGRLGDPQVTLDARIRDTELELPLSQLTIADGKATIRPGNGFIPRLDIRGESKVGGYTAFVYVYGQANAPEIAFTSDPPLPEPDVLALIATGSTPSSLTDSGTATSKAFQVFINEWRKSLAQPERGELANGAADLLGELELSSGEVDTFTGRSFTSATLRVTDRVSLYAGFDDEANSRALVIYSLRSR